MVTLFLSCETDDEISDLPSQNSTYNQGQTVNKDFNGLILDLNGNPISGATVTIGTSSKQTNSKGMFAINGASVKERFAYVKVSKPGFISGSRTLVPTNGVNRINIMLIPNTPIATIASGVTSTVALPNGTQVKFNGSFKDASGNAYSGNVQVGVYHLKPSDPYLNEIMPGSLLANNTNNQARLLETFGMMHVELTGSGGQKLNIGTGQTAEISLLIDATQASTAPSTIPLWSFDENTGIWKEEGSATKIGDKYVGNVSHFSWWNCDTSLDFCTLNAHVENSSGQPISNIKIDLIRPATVGWNNQRTAWTNASGNASGLIPANEVLTMKIYNSCGTLLNTSTIGPFASNTINNLPTIVLTSGLNALTVSGVLQNCSGANVVNGLVVIKNVNSTNYFWQNSTLPITNGSFSYTTNICGTSQQFKLYGEDYDALQISNEITFTATTPSTNVGIIQTCTSTNEFISFKIGNNPVKTFITNINANLINAAGTTGFNISTGQGTTNNGGFYINSNIVPVIGTVYSATNFTVEFWDGITQGYFSPSSTSNVQIIVSQIGPIGGYIDMTINGTYNDQANVQRTFTATIHVIRDN
jgi:hypothetical protein